MFDIFYSGPKPNLFVHEQEVSDIKHARELSRTRYFWWITYLADLSTWDFLWEPKPWEAHQRHAWHSQHQMDSGVYLVPKDWDESQTNYHSSPQITRLPCVENWQVPDYIDPVTVDFSWYPNPLDPPCNYMFDTKWHWDRVGGPEYRMQGATDIKYLDDIIANTQSNPELWSIPNWIDPGSINRTWVPCPSDPPYIYEFAVEWGWNNIGGPEYHVPGATERKYVDYFVAHTLPDTEKFIIKHKIDSASNVLRWAPNPAEPPYIYVFGNQWYPAEIMATVEYHVPGATERKYMDHPRATLVEQHSKHWNTLMDCEWDYSWVPDPGDPPYIYVFGNQWYPATVMPTVEYTVEGATERKYMDIPAQLLPDTAGPWKILHTCKWDYSWRPEPGSPSYIYVFGNQWWPAEKMATVEYHMPGATERKYMPGPVAQLPVDMTLWYIPEGVDVRDMNFSWVPDPGEPAYIYQFATQHQKTGGPQYRVPGATEVKYLDMMRAEVSQETVPIFEIDHLDGNAGQIPNTVRRVRYFDNYRDTLIRLAKNIKGEYEHVWVCSSVCDYTDFDFSWHPESWQTTMLHVFASDGEKFGDTFYMHVPTFVTRAEKKELLEWYAVNYVPRKQVPRRPIPVFHHTDDCHINAVKHTEFTAPLALFTVEPHIDCALSTVPLWREEVKTITPISKGASAVIVPKAAVPYIKTQMYDYPYIDKTKAMLSSQPLDIVFIDNGEPNADSNFAHLNSVTYNLKNPLRRSSGVDGRVAAYKAAAELSTTPWFFAVFAKLRVDEKFDWSWQPDRMQEPKHYIFHAHNPVNGLTYGHQAMIAYNRELVLNNPGIGLDFTLDSAHEVVPILSGTAEYVYTPWMAWRTAFRECIKLRGSIDVESQYRLEKWLTVGTDYLHGEYSIYGAEDAVEYYEAVGGNFEDLKKSYDWEWLASYAFLKRSLIPDQ